MSARQLRWLIAILFYFAFVLFYTDFGGPVTKDEIGQWESKMQNNGANATRIDFFKRFLLEDTGRQFLMVNVIDLNNNPPTVEGAQAGETADDLMGRYLAHIVPDMLKGGSHPVLAAPAVYPALDIVGIENATDWDQGALVRYKSRRAFMHIISHPDILGKHKYKLAALEKTIAYPIEPGFYLADLRFVLALILLLLLTLIDSITARRQLKRLASA